MSESSVETPSPQSIEGLPGISAEAVEKEAASFEATYGSPHPTASMLRALSARVVELEQGAQWCMEDRVQIIKLQDQLSSLQSQLAEREWRPIESAPKDGTSILACGPGVTEAVIIGWSDGWQDCDGPLSGLTHWMPLPPPPVSPQEREPGYDANGSPVA